MRPTSPSWAKPNHLPFFRCPCLTVGVKEKPLPKICSKMLKKMSDGPDGVYSALRTCPSIKMGMEDEPVFFYIPPRSSTAKSPGTVKHYTGRNRKWSSSSPSTIFAGAFAVKLRVVCSPSNSGHVCWYLPGKTCGKPQQAYHQPSKTMSTVQTAEIWPVALISMPLLWRFRSHLAISNHGDHKSPKLGFVGPNSLNSMAQKMGCDPNYTY